MPSDFWSSYRHLAGRFMTGSASPAMNTQNHGTDTRGSHHGPALAKESHVGEPKMGSYTSRSDLDVESAKDLPASSAASTNSLILSKAVVKTKSIRRLPLILGIAMAIGFLAAILIPSLVFGLKQSDSSTSAASVSFGNGSYVGTANHSTGVTKWLGIRYAAPPTGDLRFRAPEPPAPVTGTIQAIEHGSTCLATGSTTITAGFSEDCLFLDVYAPTRASSDSTLFPVYVFFQGGGFNSLSNRNYDGTSLIQAGSHQLVIVTFNYRVGPYGFLASKEVQDDGDLNVGLLDQRAVLLWVQENISKFGGDPSHVTIGGDSAGGASVDLHLSAYGGRDDGLFHAAAAESQSFGAQFSVEESQYQYNGLVQRTGCSDAQDTLQCLRELPIEALQAKNVQQPTPGGAGGDPLFMYSNVIDGNFTRQYTYRAFMDGNYINVPTIFGDTTNEGTIFTPTSLATKSAMNDFLTNNFPNITSEQLDKIDEYYPVGLQYPGKGEYFSAGAAAYGDMRYICPGMYLSGVYANATTAKYGSNKSWNYHYNVSTQNDEESGIGVPHVAEVTAIWGITNPSATIAYNCTDPDTVGTTSSNSTIVAHIGPIIQGYWTSFIRSKDPNTYRYPGTPEWMPWDADAASRLRFQLKYDGTEMESAPADQRERCAYLTSIGIELQQ